MVPRIETRIETRRLADLSPISKNARYMEKHEFDRLVANIRQDGCLTSAPLVYDLDVKGEVLSGNHRVKAGIEAGIESCSVIVIVTPLTPEQKVAIQLSHNRLTGKDDASVLKELYDFLGSLPDKAYSGLTDDDFKIDEISIQPISFAAPETETVTLLFLKEDQQVFLDQLETLERLAKKKGNTVVMANMSDFYAFYNNIVAIKQVENILNMAEAIKILAETALEQHAGSSSGASSP